MKRLIQADVLWLSSYTFKERPLYIKTKLSKLRVDSLLKMRRYPSFQEFTVETEGGLIFDVVSTENKDAVFYRLPRFVSYIRGKDKGKSLFLNLNLKGELSPYRCSLSSQWDCDNLYFQIDYPSQLQLNKLIFMISEYTEGIPYIKGEIDEKVEVKRKSETSELDIDSYLFTIVLEKKRLSLKLKKDIFDLPLGYGVWRVNFLILFRRGEVVFSPSFSEQMLPEMAGILLFSQE